MPPDGADVKKSGATDIAAIATAYAPYLDAQPKMVVREPYFPDCPARRYRQHMTGPERKSWDRLEGQYIPKIALLLDTEFLTTGKLSNTALDRTAVIASYMFGIAIRIHGMIHGDRDEAIGMKALNYITQNPGCRDHAVYRHLRCSAPKFRADYAPTLVARGDVHTKKGAWYPGAGASDRFVYKDFDCK